MAYGTTQLPEVTFSLPDADPFVAHRKVPTQTTTTTKTNHRHTRTFVFAPICCCYSAARENPSENFLPARRALGGSIPEFYTGNFATCSSRRRIFRSSLQTLLMQTRRDVTPKSGKFQYPCLDQGLLFLLILELTQKPPRMKQISHFFL